MRTLQGHVRLCAAIAGRLDAYLTALEARTEAEEPLAKLRRLERALQIFGGARALALAPHEMGPWLQANVRELDAERAEAVVTPVISDTLPTLSIDAELLTRALREIVDNGCRAGAHHITLSADVRAFASVEIPRDLSPGNYLTIELCDDGAGMEAEQRERALWPGFSGWRREGLGLSIAHGVAVAHGGWLELLPKVRGTCIRLTLPAEDEGARAEGEELPSLLLVDDEPLALKALTRVLKRRGYHLLVAETPAVALDLAHATDPPPRLLITDINMPGMDGFELARRLREDFDELSVLYICGYPIETLDIAPSDHGLAKPFTHDELLSAVREALGPA